MSPGFPHFGAGCRADPAWDLRALQRSFHDNFLTLPVHLFMIRIHGPVLDVVNHLSSVGRGVLAMGAWMARAPASNSDATFPEFS
ncbi:MAG: urate hydroxylase PuuD [Pseudomonadota bacterium]